MRLSIPHERAWQMSTRVPVTDVVFDRFCIRRDSSWGPLRDLHILWHLLEVSLS